MEGVALPQLLQDNSDSKEYREPMYWMSPDKIKCSYYSGTTVIKIETNNRER